MAFESVPLYIAFKEFLIMKGDLGIIEGIKEAKDPTIIVVLFEDAAAMLGLVTAMIGIYLTQVTGILIFDGISSVLIGVILGITAAVLAFDFCTLPSNQVEARPTNGVKIENI